MGFVGTPPSECPGHERVPRYVSRPRFAERAREREQHRTRCERDHRAAGTDDVTARVHDECARRQQRFDLFEQEEPLPAARNQPRCGRVQDENGAVDFRRQRRDASVARGVLGPGERGARRLRPEPPHREPRGHQLVGRPRRRRQTRGVEPGEGAFGLVDPSDQ
jgi:hypothetical protein